MLKKIWFLFHTVTIFIILLIIISSCEIKIGGLGIKSSSISDSLSSSFLNSSFSSSSISSSNPISSYSSRSSMSSPSTGGIVAEYLFNGDANDTSGNGNHGTVNGAIMANDRFNNPNSAYYFNGINANIEVRNLFYMAYYPISYSFWFKLDHVLPYKGPGLGESRQTILGRNKYYQANAGCFGIYNDNGFGTSEQNRLLYYTGNSDFNSSFIVNNTSWIHVVLTWDGNMAVFYINGNITAQSSSTIPSGAQGIKFMIGSREGTTEPEYFNGIIDDIRIYNRIISYGEITSLYHESGW
jgi:hypothetical protein